MGPALYRSLQSLMRWIAYSAVFVFALNQAVFGIPTFQPDWQWAGVCSAQCSFVQCSFVPIVSSRILMWRGISDWKMYGFKSVFYPGSLHCYSSAYFPDLCERNFDFNIQFIGERPYKCTDNECGQSFSTQTILNNHRLTHLGYFIFIFTILYFLQKQIEQNNFQLYAHTCAIFATNDLRKGVSLTPIFLSFTQVFRLLSYHISNTLFSSNLKYLQSIYADPQAWWKVIMIR